MENTHNIVFTNEELQVVFEALAELPYKKAANIIGTIQNQLQAEYAEKQKKETEKVTEKKEENR